jgi:hypothetical protein
MHNRNTKSRIKPKCRCRKFLAGNRMQLTKAEKIKPITIYSLIGLATLLGFAASAIVSRLPVLLAGLGIVTYVFSLRHRRLKRRRVIFSRNIHCVTENITMRQQKYSLNGRHVTIPVCHVRLTPTKLQSYLYLRSVREQKLNGRLLFWCTCRTNGGN